MSLRDDADQSPKPPKREKSRVGRAIVTVVWLCIVGSTSTAAVVSVVRDLYGKPPPHAEATFTDAERDWCVRQLTGLKTDIQSHATNELQRPPLRGAPLSRWQDWLGQWTDRLSIAASRCRAGGEAMSDSFERLRDLATTYDEGVGRVLRARTDMGQEIDAAARALSGR